MNQRITITLFLFVVVITMLPACTKILPTKRVVVEEKGALLPEESEANVKTEPGMSEKNYSGSENRRFSP